MESKESWRRSAGALSVREVFRNLKLGPVESGRNLVTSAIVVVHVFSKQVVKSSKTYKKSSKQYETSTSTGTGY